MKKVILRISRNKHIKIKVVKRMMIKLNRVQLTIKGKMKKKKRVKKIVKKKHKGKEKIKIMGKKKMEIK